jgi:D-alanine-D-alanine ligase
MTEDGRLFVLEANPNPNLSYGEDFSESAEKVGIHYGELLQKIISLGMKYRAAWAQFE